MFSRLRVLRCSVDKYVMAIAAVALMVAALLPAAAGAALTDAEQLYRQTRKSSDRSTQLLGERWYGLVKRQQWTDDTGKFTTTAKYLEHDPDLKWVKLRVERTAGGHRETKDMTVPVDRLSKTCQSRVRQIAFLEPKVREAATAAQQEAETRAEEREQEREDRARQSEQRGQDAERSEARGGRHGEPSDGPPSPESWATSYEAFRANFTVHRRGGEYQVDWGTLGVLQQVHDALLTPAGTSAVPSPLQAVGLAAQLASVGEFTWEAKLTKPPADDSKWAERLDLEPLPEPLSLELVLNKDAGDWKQFKVGDQVRLTGRFIAFAGPYKIVAAIRFSDQTSGRRSSRAAAR